MMYVNIHFVPFVASVAVNTRTRLYHGHNGEGSPMAQTSCICILSCFCRGAVSISAIKRLFNKTLDGIVSKVLLVMSL